MNRLLLLLLMCLFPGLVWAAAGKLEAFEGDVKVIAKGATRNGASGIEVNEGDQVRTGANSWALIEMSDGALITVRASTDIRISKYRFVEDGPAAQNSSTIDIIKGALRMVTGLIGQSNRSGYAVNTPTATIGIRGTDYEPAYYPPGDPEVADHEPGAFDKVNDGETFLRNEAGQEVVVRRGRVAFMAQNRRLAPRLLDDEPPLYRRMAIQEKRVAARRAALHQRIEERRKQRQELRKENLELQRENRQFARELRQENMAEKKAAREAAGDSHPNMDKGEKAERRAKMLEKRERLMNKGEER
jgi:hypothetical protein